MLSILDSSHDCLLSLLFFYFTSSFRIAFNELFEIEQQLFFHAFIQLLLVVAVVIVPHVHQQQVLIAMYGMYQLDHARLADLVVPQADTSHVGVLFDGLSELDGTRVPDLVFTQVQKTDA